MKTGVFDAGTLTNKERLLAAYNGQDSEALLALDGSARLHGKAELRAYWTRQWARQNHFLYAKPTCTRN